MPLFYRSFHCRMRSQKERTWQPEIRKKVPEGVLIKCSRVCSYAPSNPEKKHIYRPRKRYKKKTDKQVKKRIHITEHAAACWYAKREDD